MMQTTLQPSTVGELRARIRERWPALADDDIERAGGRLEKLIDAIHAATGEARPAIKRDLRRVLVS